MHNLHCPLRYCIKSVRIWSFSGLYFPTFRLNTLGIQSEVWMRENMDQKNSECGHWSHSESPATKKNHNDPVVKHMVIASIKTQKQRQWDFLVRLIYWLWTSIFPTDTVFFFTFQNFTKSEYQEQFGLVNY